MLMPDETLCPSKIAESLTRYTEAGVPTGDFLRSVLTNDLRSAVVRADPFNLAALPHIVVYCVNKIPAACWGSKKAVDDWIEKHRAGRREFAKLESGT